MTHTCYKNNNNVTKPKHCLQTGNHTMLQMLQMLQVFWKLEMKKSSMGKLKMKIIPRRTSEALKFFRQVRFLPDFDPDRADISSVP